MFKHRLAQLNDLDALRDLMHRSIDQLQSDYLSQDQIRASHELMGLDRQLILDQTYFVVERHGVLAGCGGWSWRSTLFGGDESAVAREPTALDPATDPARIRAMYTCPKFVRQGVASILMQVCERAALDHGFKRIELMATLAGSPLYQKFGYLPAQHATPTVNGVVVPMVRMRKTLADE